MCTRRGVQGTSTRRLELHFRWVGGSGPHIRRLRGGMYWHVGWGKVASRPSPQPGSGAWHRETCHKWSSKYMRSTCELGCSRAWEHMEPSCRVLGCTKPPVALALSLTCGGSMSGGLPGLPGGCAFNHLEHWSWAKDNAPAQCCTEAAVTQEGPCYSRRVYLTRCRSAARIVGGGGGLMRWTDDRAFLGTWVQCWGVFTCSIPSRTPL